MLVVPSTHLTRQTLHTFVQTRWKNPVHLGMARSTPLAKCALVFCYTALAVSISFFPKGKLQSLNQLAALIDEGPLRVALSSSKSYQHLHLHSTRMTYCTQYEQHKHTIRSLLLPTGLFAEGVGTMSVYVDDLDTPVFISPMSTDQVIITTAHRFALAAFFFLNPFHAISDVDGPCRCRPFSSHSCKIPPKCRFSI